LRKQDEVQWQITPASLQCACASKSSFLNLLLIALHDMVTFPVHISRNAERATVRMRCIRAHPNLILVDTIALNYETDAERELLFKMLRGVSDHIPQPRGDHAGKVDPNASLVQLVSDALVVDLNQVVDQVIWLVNPCEAEELNASTGQFQINPTLLPDVQDLFMTAGSIVSTQLPPFVVFTHGDECGTPPHLLLESYGWHERSRKRVVSNYSELPDGNSTVQRSFERELVALQILAALLVQCQPMLARFLR